MSVALSITARDAGGLERVATDGLIVRLARRLAVQLKGGMTGTASTIETALLADIRKVATARDRAAFARLYDFYAPRIAAFLRRGGATGELAEDLAQEVMLTVWRKADRFDPEKAALGTWIYTIARNRRIDALRREKHPALDQDDPTLEPEEAPRGDHALEAALLKNRIARAIASLPPEQAELLRVFFFEDKSHSVIADELRLPLGTVKSRLRLAVGKLRGMLEGLE